MAFIKNYFFPPEPWRKVPSLTSKDYRDYISKFSPENDEVKHIRVMLYGPSGAGKSSFINTCETSIRGRITGQASTDSIGHESFTQKLKTHRVKIEKEKGTYFPFVFMDLMGLEKNKEAGVRVGDIKLVLQGHVKDGYEFKPKTPLSEDNEFYNPRPTINDKTHVLVCVVPATTVDLLDDDFIKKMRKVRLAARDLGIPQMAILTKVDEVKPDYNNVYESKRIENKVSALSASLGIQPNHIFPVKNYHSEVEVEETIDTLALMAFKHMLDFGQDFVNSYG